MTEDLEITAMATISAALTELDDGARRRVVEWVAKRFEINIALAQTRGAREGRRIGGDAVTEEDFVEYGEFAHFVDLFDATGPKTDHERALVAGYWFQVAEGGGDFQGQQINNALKDVGHGITNITNALARLQNRKPALVRQVSKSGRTKQARKRYKLTTAGIATVRTMVAGGGDE